MENKKFIVIACRHCQRHNPLGADQSGLTEEGKKQAGNIAKMLVLAKKGLIEGVPADTYPKTLFYTKNMQCGQTFTVIRRSLANDKMKIPQPTDIPLSEETKCRLEICSAGLGNFDETVMGGMAFISMENGKLKDRIFFCPNQIEDFLTKNNI